MSKTVLSFSFAGLLCQLITDNSHLASFLKKKYQLFLTEKERLQKDSLKLYLSSKRKKPFETKIECIIPPLRGKIRVVSLKNLTRRFRTFNFIFKCIFGTYLLFNDGFLLHASAFVIDNKAHVFSGKRRVGKSTIIKLHPHHLPLNDDGTILKKVDNKFWIYASPFYEKKLVPKNKRRYSIEGVYFLKQSKENRLRRLEDKNIVLAKLLANTYCLWVVSSKSFRQLASPFDLMPKAHLQFRREIPFYELQFRKEKGFFDKLLSREGI